MVPVLVMMTVTTILFALAISDAKTHNDEGVSILESLATTAECMDSYTVFN